uniref:Uncharacterized protein n=1 Tax=Oryzias latipes TaxID=8090 RepID=A0A3P9K0F9_ORYLA
HHLKLPHSILKTAKLPPSNVTKKEMAAIRNLKNNREITILPADKGRTTVILDTEQYEKQMNEIKVNPQQTLDKLKLRLDENWIFQLMATRPFRSERRSWSKPRCGRSPCVAPPPRVRRPGKSAELHQDFFLKFLPLFSLTPTCAERAERDRN